MFTTREPDEIYGTNGTLVMENVLFENVQKLVAGPTGTIVDETNVEDTQSHVFVMVCDFYF